MPVKRRHSDGCPARSGRRCKCKAGWQASVYSARDKKPLRKTFPRKGEAVSWEADTKRGVDQGTVRAPKPTTLAEAWAAWDEGVKKGEILNREGKPFKPSTLRGYRRDIERILPDLGGQKLGAITAQDLQVLVDRWQGEDCKPSTILNALKPVRAIYRRAMLRDGLAVNPTRNLDLPAAKAKEVEIVSPVVAVRLLEALPEEARSVWATALYAGLRRGELMALRWGAADLASGRITVRESWDWEAGSIDPKTDNSCRVVAVPGRLRDLLLERRVRCGEPAAADLVFGEGTDTPFSADALHREADKAWEGAGLTERLRLHQARHTYASMMIASQVNPKALCELMGHSSIKITFDTYGHLMPGAKAEAAALLDETIAQGEQAAREADTVQADGGTGTPAGTRQEETA